MISRRPTSTALTTSKPLLAEMLGIKDMRMSDILDKSTFVSASGVSSAIRVINLPSAASRRQLFKTANEGISSLDWEFYPAASGSDLTIEYDEKATISDFGRPMMSAELGCYQSHINLWRWFLSSDHDQLFVFEDDVAIDPFMLTRLYNTDMQAMGIGVLRLYSTLRVRMKLVSELILSSHLCLFQARGMMFGTQAYCITREAARALLSISLPITQPVDWLMMRYWRYGIANFIIFPHPVFEFQASSSIDTSGLPPPSAAQKLSKIGRMVRDRARREWADRITLASTVKAVKEAIDKEPHNLNRE